MKKNEIYEIIIKDIGTKGEGIGRVDDFVVFVPFALVGETVKVKILKVKSRYAYGKIEEILVKSENREEPQCLNFKKCGSCDFLHTAYHEELRFKYKKVTETLKRIGNIDCRVLPVLGMDDFNRYRNKSQFPVTQKNGETVIGFYQKNSHNVIETNKCVIQNESCSLINEAVKKYMRESGDTAYIEETHSGNIKTVYTRVSRAFGNTMVVIVTKTGKLKNKQLLINCLLNSGADITSIMLNINSKKTNVVLGEEFVVLYGEPFIYDQILNTKFKISPQSFYQVNPVQTEKLYKTALDFADIKTSDTVFDLYCGIGTISLCAAKKAGKVVGIELVEQAIENAKENARLNGISNAEFYLGSAETVTYELYKKGYSADIVIIDPPRKGCDFELIKTISKLNPKKVVYVSCDVATLARDLKIFKEKGYDVQKVQPVDMFPRTSHVETVVLLQRQNT